MTVEKLINQLQKCNPKAIVKMHHKDGEPVLFAVCAKDDDKQIWLECESDNDMGEEIGARFDNMTEVWGNELNFYTDLLETGIDVNMVRKYMDDLTANRMEQFCIKHNLI